MTLSHRNNATNKPIRSYAAVASAATTSTATTSTATTSTLPNLSIHVPESVATTNPYSALESDKESDKDSDKDSDKESDKDSEEENEYTWNDINNMPFGESETDSADDTCDDMPSLVDASDESTDESTDESVTVSEQEEDFVSDKTSDEDVSEDDIIVNHTQYRRVVTNKRCKDGIPFPITCAFIFFALAHIMQLVFLLCGKVNHRRCISDPF